MAQRTLKRVKVTGLPGESEVEAGARSMLVSHWQVEDTATADLMVRLFERMRAKPGMGWAEALREAQMSLIADARQPSLQFRSHPLFWGAFTLVGDGSKGAGRL